MLDLWHEFELTILFVTHDPEEAVFLSDRTYVLSPRPASVTDTLNVDLPHPRRHELVATAEFADLKRRVLQPLWQAEGAPEQPHGGPGRGEEGHVDLPAQEW